MDRQAPPSTEDFRHAGQLLLRLHGGVGEQSLTGFRHWVLEQLESILDFDSAMWGSASDEPRQMHEVCLYRQPRAMLESYARYQDDDFLRDEVCRVPGRTVNLADLMTPEQLLHQRIYREHAIPFHATQVLCTADVDPATTLIHTLVLFRADSQRPFSERDRQIKEFLFPHLLQMAREHCFRLLRRQAPVAGELYRMAVADGEGVLQQVEPGFSDLLSHEWPEWQGAGLPAPLIEDIEDTGETGCFDGSLIHARLQKTGGLLLLQLRPRVAADRLTARERQVARAYARGLSHRAIAAQLQISPSTVRNQLNSVYRKLGINDKSRLAEALRPLL